MRRLLGRVKKRVCVRAGAVWERQRTGRSLAGWLRICRLVPATAVARREHAVPVRAGKTACAHGSALCEKDGGQAGFWRCRLRIYRLVPAAAVAWREYVAPDRVGKKTCVRTGWCCAGTTAVRFLAGWPRIYRAVNGGGPSSQGGKRPSTAGDNSTVVMTARCLENRPAYTGKGRPSTACRLLVCWYVGVPVCRPAREPECMGAVLRSGRGGGAARPDADKRAAAPAAYYMRYMI